jgi:hypothetical protein
MLALLYQGLGRVWGVWGEGGVWGIWQGGLIVGVGNISWEGRQVDLDSRCIKEKVTNGFNVGNHIGTRLSIAKRN